MFCVDEKTAIQALDRLDPVLPLSPGRAERHGFEYHRHGTLSLYAALDTKTGKVHGITPEMTKNSSGRPRATSQAEAKPVNLANASTRETQEKAVNSSLITNKAAVELDPGSRTKRTEDGLNQPHFRQFQRSSL